MTRTVGLDLAVTGPGVFTVVNAQYDRVKGPVKFRQDLEGMEQMLTSCRQGMEEGDKLAFIMEPTGHTWTRVVGFLHGMGETLLYAPSPRKFSALRKTLNIGVKNDGLDSLALARLPAVAKESLHQIVRPSVPEFSLKRVMGIYGQVTQEIVRTKTRLQALMGLVHQGVLFALSKNEFTEVARCFIREVADPREVPTLERLEAVLSAQGRPLNQRRLQAVLDLCQANGRFLTHCEAKKSLPLELGLVSLEARELLEHLEQLEKRQTSWARHRDRLVKVLDPEGLLQSVVGIGPQIAGAIYGYSAPMSRFANIRAYKGYVGLVPGSHQSGGNKRPVGTSITKAGPNPLKAAYYQAAKVAVLHDPELATFACRLQDRGLKYSQVIVAVANKLMARVYAVVKRHEQSKAETMGRDQAEDRNGEERTGVERGGHEGSDLPVKELRYELRSVDAKPISKLQAKEQIAEGYRMKSARYPDPPRRRSSVVMDDEPVQSPAEATRCGEGADMKTPPESARQSLTPQPEAAPKGDVEAIIAACRCPSDLKDQLRLHADLLQEPSGVTLRDYLGTRAPDPELLRVQLSLLILRQGLA